MNNLCSTLQPCLVRMGNEGINEEMITLLITLAVDTFKNFEKVMNGGLFILHGLICTIEDRILPYC